MKVLFIGGGGSGGHFYPLLAVARALKKLADQEHIIGLHLFFAADTIIDAKVLEEEGIHTIKIPSGKLPAYASLAYITTPFKVLFGVSVAFFKLFFLLPDVIFSKGGYSAFPILLVARLLRIPVIVHESDTIPGKVNRWSGKWANRIAISFPDTAKYFKNPNIALTGNPIRHQVVGGNLNEAIETFHLEEKTPLLLILGGSQGSQAINDAILGVVHSLVENYQVMHQTGRANYDEVVARASVLLETSPNKHRYHPVPYFQEADLRNVTHATSLVISRAGSGGIFEIAAWQLPAIIIPLEGSAQDHQRENAYAYARLGGCEVIDQINLTPHILLSAIDKLLANKEKIATMKRAAQEFAKLDAAEYIAQEILKLGIH
jgi:UDP-N-acetylglucosamine--N-acetylmuramyl-(pentapeptide) pyrophosphoryl-undecaprenol N-acetylglucosamine transferase